MQRYVCICVYMFVVKENMVILKANFMIVAPSERCEGAKLGRRLSSW